VVKVATTRLEDDSMISFKSFCHLPFYRARAEDYASLARGSIVGPTTMGPFAMGIDNFRCGSRRKKARREIRDDPCVLGA